MKKKTEKPSIQKQSTANDAAPTLHAVDQAMRDATFVYAVLDTISELSMSDDFDEFPGATINALCGEAREKADKLKRFVETAPHR